jgi:uncharacterized protein
MAKKETDDRFARFGTVSFTLVSKVNDFVDYLDSGKVMGTVCLNCGRKYFPPRADCRECLSDRMEWFEVGGKGRLLTYSRLQFAPKGFEEDLPYSIGVVDYGDCRVFGRIDKDLPECEIRVGMEMSLEVEKLPANRVAYVFRSAGEKHS